MEGINKWECPVCNRKFIPYTRDVEKGTALYTVGEQAIDHLAMHINQLVNSVYKK